MSFCSFCFVDSFAVMPRPPEPRHKKKYTYTKQRLCIEHCKVITPCDNMRRSACARSLREFLAPVHCVSLLARVPCAGSCARCLHELIARAHLRIHTQTHVNAYMHHCMVVTKRTNISMCERFAGASLSPFDRYTNRGTQAYSHLNDLLARTVREACARTP